MNNLLVRDVKYLDEQYRIGEGIISDDAFKQLEKLFIPVDPEPGYFNPKNNKLLPKLAKENYKELIFLTILIKIKQPRTIETIDESKLPVTNWIRP